MAWLGAVAVSLEGCEEILTRGTALAHPAPRAHQTPLAVPRWAIKEVMTHNGG